MKKLALWFSIALAAALTFLPTLPAQGRRNADTAKLIADREAMEKELESLAIVERKVMVPMRDGKRMATDIYRPRDSSKKYATVFVRTPYNFNFWDVRNGTYS